MVRTMGCGRSLLSDVIQYAIIEERLIESVKGDMERCKYCKHQTQVLDEIQ